MIRIQEDQRRGAFGLCEKEKNRLTPCPPNRGKINKETEQLQGS